MGVGISLKTTEQQCVDLLIEKLAFEEVIRQFSAGDGRMSVTVDALCRTVERQVQEIEAKMFAACGCVLSL